MKEKRDYKSYLLRLWRAGEKRKGLWQAMLENPHTGERHSFTGVDALFSFLRATTGTGREAGKSRFVNAPIPMEVNMLLRKGDRGEAVARVQQALRDEGFDIVVDGIFGPGTEAAVRAFQERSGLIVDGIVGPNTLDALGLDEAGAADGSEQDDGGMLPAGEATDWAAFKVEVVRLANREWARWHDGGKQTETEAEMTPILQEYYRAGVHVEVTADQLQDPDWQENHPWSAVFISWVMRTAGARDKFRYARAHQRYIAAAKRNREENDADNPFWAFRVSEVTPEVGDLVCARRANSGATYDNIDDGFRATHCDIVTEVRPGGLTVIGGNVGNTVGKKTSVRTDAQGFISLTGKQKRFFAVIRIRTDL